MIEAVAPDVVAERVIRDRDRIFGAAFDKRLAGTRLEQAPAGRASEGADQGEIIALPRVELGPGSLSWRRRVGRRASRD